MLNRDTASRLAISSPLEAHKSNAIIFHTCGVDVGFDNPIFAVSWLCCDVSPPHSCFRFFITPAVYAATHPPN